MGAFLPCYCIKSFISVSAFDLLINFPLELLTHLLFMFVLYTWNVVLIFQYINRKPVLVKLWVNPRKFSFTESFSVYRSSCSQGILWKSCSRKTCKIRRETPVPQSLFNKVAGFSMDVLLLWNQRTSGPAVFKEFWVFHVGDVFR